MNFEQVIRECDAFVRAGHDPKAVAILSTLDGSKIPRKWRLPLAALCRRVAQIPLGLRILSPLVSASNRGAPATSHELAEYAALLQKLGAVEDALRMLARVDHAEVPEALMYKAVCHFTRWEYPDAVPLLEKYVGVAPSPYQALIGRVNLAAALVGTHRLSEAEVLLVENIRIASESGATRLEGNCNELLTQVHLLKNDLAEARKRLVRAETLITGPHSLDRLFTNKCRAALDALEAQSVEPLLGFRVQAAAWPHAETVREVDLYTLMVERNEELLDRLYFGTPFSFYRERVERLLGTRPSKTELVVGSNDGPCLDIVSGECPGGASLKPGSTVHKVLSALLRDFYRPARFGSLFGQLFSGEHFDIHSSPARVHQSLRRARKWLRDNDIPAEIKESAGTYTLEITGAISFRLPVERSSIDRFESSLMALAKEFPGAAPFTAADASVKLGMTLSSFHRFLRPMLESGRIQKFGASTSTVYFVPENAAAAA